MVEEFIYLTDRVTKYKTLVQSRFSKTNLLYVFEYEYDYMNYLRTKKYFFIFSFEISIKELTTQLKDFLTNEYF
jgi:hypothetical protein